MSVTNNSWEDIEDRPLTEAQKALLEARKLEKAEQSKAKKKAQEKKNRSLDAWLLKQHQEGQETPKDKEARQQAEKQHFEDVNRRIKEAAQGPKSLSHEDMLKMQDVRGEKEKKRTIPLVIKEDNRSIALKNLTQEEIVAGLIARDNKITDAFFYGKCTPVLHAIIDQMFSSYHMDYNSLINEFYYYLMKPGSNGEDAYNLKSFKFQSSIYSWLKIVAGHFFSDYREKIEKDMNNNTDTFEEEGPDEDEEGNQVVREWDSAGDDEMARLEAKRAMESYLQMMVEQATSKRAKEAALKYVTVIRKLILEDKDPEQVAGEMEINVNNLYVQKKRAVEALAKVALLESKK